MFTDQPVTPMRLEVLVDFIRTSTSTKINRKMLIEVLQPDAIVAEDASRTQAKQTIKAATDLGLVDEGSETLNLTFPSKDRRKTREIVLAAIDSHILSATTVEPYFAPFYSYLLHLNEKGATGRSGDEWARDFQRDVYQDKPMNNQFNREKYTGLNRWYSYAGLGWFDPAGTFQPNPYYRLMRVLPIIFKNKFTRISGEEFMRSVATTCPELDGGDLYSETVQHLPANAGLCTLGLSHALIDLHMDGFVQLNCPADARGWDISLAQPPLGGTINSTFIDSIEYLKPENRKK